MSFRSIHVCTSGPCITANESTGLKSLAKRFLALIARSDAACRALLPALREIERQRRQQQSQFAARALAALPTLAVQHGPFTGLVYPTAQAHGSVLYPKLLGSYERELHSALEEILAEPLTAIVDIGCAEGYYAVGLAMRAPETPVFAFDTDAQARESCRQMAVRNDVAALVTVGEECSAERLTRLALGRHALVVSDCEGAERWIFTDDVAEALRPHHLIIELHDFLQPGTGELLVKRLGRTHSLLQVDALDDDDRISRYQYAELATFSERQRWQLLTEGRPAGMSWLVCSPSSG